jgi:hypothetical protein
MSFKNYVHIVVLFVFVFFSILTAHPQGNVNNIQIMPSNPTTSDHIMIIGDVMLWNSACPLLNIMCYQNGPGVIEVHAYHCYGMLPAVCNALDTCTVSPLPAGTYNLAFYLWTGSPCPNPMTYQCADTAFKTIIVTTISSFSENKQGTGILINPNPCNESLFLTNFNEEGELLILAMDGRLLEKHSLASGKNELSLDLSTGLYLAVFHNKDYYSKGTPLSIIR